METITNGRNITGKAVAMDDKIGIVTDGWARERGRGVHQAAVMWVGKSGPVWENRSDLTIVDLAIAS